MKVKFAALLLVHRRAWLIPLIAEQISKEFPDSILQITLDRPSLPVIEAVERAKVICPITLITNAPFPALDSVENFMKLRNFQLAQVVGPSPEYIAIWDDDHILARPGELKLAMERRHDLIYGTKMFFWDGVDRVNTAIPEHTSVFAFRYRPGDTFPEDRFIHACSGVHDDSNSSKMRLIGPLYDIGYISANERQRVFSAYKLAGKIDNVTLSLVEPPILKPFAPRRWCPAYKALKEAYCEYTTRKPN